MNKTFFGKLATGVAAVAALAFFAGCSDDSSTPVIPPIDEAPLSSAVDSPLSSSSLVPPADDLGQGGIPAGPSNENLSSSSAMPGVDAPENPSENPPVVGDLPPYDDRFGFYNSPVVTGIAVAPDEDGFYDMADVYKAVPATSKIAFVIRHSKRERNVGTEAALTPIGIQMANDLGKRMGGDEKFYYASTDFLRTRSTCERIAEGRGETAEVVTWDAINGGYFLTVPSDTLDEAVKNRGGNAKYIAMNAYGVEFPAAVAKDIQDYFYDHYPRGKQFVHEVVVANMPNWERVSILVSHDLLMEPLIAYVSDRTINLKIYQKPYHWANYLSGIAVIIDANGSITVLPVKGAEFGWMIVSEDIKE